MKTIAIFDPTAKDEQSKFRGVGRYFKTLKKTLGTIDRNLKKNLNNNSNIEEIYLKYFSEEKELKQGEILINPFFNPTQKAKNYKKAKKKIAIIHDLIPLKFKKYYPTGLKGIWYNFVNKRIIKKYDFIVTDSQISKNDIVSIYSVPQEKVQVIYPCVDKLFLPHLSISKNGETHHPFHKENTKTVAEFTDLPLKLITQNQKLAELKNFVIYVGDATWNKNLPNIARAIKLTNIPCVFVGRVFSNENTKNIHVKPHPWQRSLNEFLKLSQGDQRFIFPGYVSDVELKILYKNAKANILVSHEEGFGYSFAEAGYMSTPSVLADRPIFHEIAKDSALFANPESPKDIAEKITQLFYDSVLQERMSIKAFSRAQEYSPKSFNDSWQNLIQII